jgi:hypothetical protein
MGRRIPGISTLYATDLLANRLESLEHVQFNSVADRDKHTGQEDYLMRDKRARRRFD